MTLNITHFICKSSQKTFIWFSVKTHLKRWHCSITVQHESEWSARVESDPDGPLADPFIFDQQRQDGESDFKVKLNLFLKMISYVVMNDQMLLWFVSLCVFCLLWVFLLSCVYLHKGSSCGWRFGFRNVCSNTVKTVSCIDNSLVN